MSSTITQFPSVVAEIQKGIESQLHLGVQLYVSLNGETIADDAIGEATPGSPLTNSHLMWWLSSGKPLTAVATLILVERDLISLDDPVAQHVPEFAEQGKSTMTLRHLLTHTAGIQPVPTGWPRASWDESLARIFRAKIRQGGQAGESPGYDPARSWFLLGEVIRRLDGRPVADFVRQEIALPLGMQDTWMAMTEETHAAYGSRIAPMFIRQESELQPVELKETQDHSIETCAVPAPGGSMRGPVRELGRFYEMLLGLGESYGTQVLNPETVEQMISRQRIGQFDTTFQHIVDFGLGVLVDSNQYGPETVPYGFGRHCSPTTFGHGGAESSIGFCDPTHRLVVAWASNGRPGESLHQERNRAINTAIYQDLGLAFR